MNLVFPVGDLLKSDSTSKVLEHQLDVDLSDLDPDLKIKSNLTGSLTLRVVGDSIGALLEDVKLVIELACLRCSTNYHHSLELKRVERYFYPPEDIPQEAEEGEYFSIDLATNRVDLSEMLRQEITFALPSYPLCSGKCLGLCDRCGQAKQVCKCKVDKQAKKPPKPLSDLSRIWKEQSEE